MNSAILLPYKSYILTKDMPLRDSGVNVFNPKCKRNLSTRPQTRRPLETAIKFGFASGG